MRGISRSSRRVILAVTLAAVAVGAVACSSGSSSSPTSGAPKPSPNFITSDEIARTNVQTVYEAIQKLRPTMLRQRQVASANGQGGVSSSAPAIRGTGVESGAVIVYMDNTRLGDVDQLKGIAASTVAGVRYFSASEAQQKWGSGHPGGAIEVLTKH